MSTNNLSIVQRPVDSAVKTPVITNWTPMLGYMIYKDQVIDTFFYYKIGLDVFLGSDATGTQIAALRQRRNGYNPDIVAGKARAFFDIKEIVNSQLVNTYYDQNLTGVPFSSLHTLGANAYDDGAGGVLYKIYSVSGDRRTARRQIDQIYVRAIDCYSTNQAAAVTCYTPTTPVENSAYYMQASLDLFQPRALTATEYDTDYIMGIAFQSYSLNSSTSLFLSDNPRVPASGYGSTTEDKSTNFIYSDKDTSEHDYHTIAFLNDEAAFDSGLKKIRIKYYTGANVALTTTDISNISDNGGFDPSTTGATATNDRKLLYFGCGPGNLEGFDNGGTNTQRPSNASNNTWTHYTIQGLDSSNNAVSQKILFIKQDPSCKGYPKRRLAWRNSLGCYDYFNFKLKSTQTTEIKRDKFGQMLGTFDASKFFYASWQRGDAVRQTTAKLKETLNTDYITEEQGTLIERLLMSTDVFIIENGDTRFTQSVVVTDSSFVKKTVANDKLIQYSITIEYSNPLNTNS
jgi:hypothetical protein